MRTGPTGSKGYPGIRAGSGPGGGDPQCGGMLYRGGRLPRKPFSYLEEHYGLVINHRDYIVAYEVFAENQPPVVQVLVRGEE